jgi:hypothetical protein
MLSGLPFRFCITTGSHPEQSVHHENSPGFSNEKPGLKFLIL